MKDQRMGVDDDGRVFMDVPVSDGRIVLSWSAAGARLIAERLAALADVAEPKKTPAAAGEEVSGG